MRRTISLVCALALTAGGLYWLADTLLIFDAGSGVILHPKAFKMYTMAPLMMTVLGGFWLWEDLKLRKGGK